MPVCNKELPLGLLAMLFTCCDEVKQLQTGHAGRQEQRFFHPPGEASKLKNKPNFGGRGGSQIESKVLEQGNNLFLLLLLV